MTRTRIARVITRLNVGGPAIQAMALTELVDPERFETLLISGQAGADEGEMTDVRPRPGVAPFVITSLRRRIAPVEDLRTLWRIVRVLHTYRPDIVHTHLAKAGVIARIAARLTGVPIVLHTFHGNVFSGYFGRRTSRVIVLVERLLARLSTRIIVISPRQHAEIEALRIARGQQIVEIPLGIDLAEFLNPPTGELRAELGLGKAAPLVGTVARLVAIKGIEVFLDAAARVHQQDPEVHFVIVGDGERRAELEEQAGRLDLRPVVHFLGWRSDLPRIYGDLDAVTLTSWNEGTPVTLIEALAAGRAVVATDVGAVRDVVGESGVLVPAGDARAVADGLLRVLRDRELARTFGEGGRARVFPAYDVSTLVERIESLYDMLLAERRRA